MISGDINSFPLGGVNIGGFSGISHVSVIETEKYKERYVPMNIDWSKIIHVRNVDERMPKMPRKLKKKLFFTRSIRRRIGRIA
jgi:hypothetical protein